MATKLGRSGRITCAFVLSFSLVSAQTRAANFQSDPCAPSASCPNLANTPAPAEPMSKEERALREAPKSSKNDLLLALFIAAAIVAAILLADELTGKKWASAEDLDTNGPRFPNAQALGRYQVQGYAAPGWPFAVDLETLPETNTWLQLKYKDNGKDREARIDIPYRRGRHIEVVRLPASAGRGLGVARYTIHSAFEKEGEVPVYQPLKVYGLGAGPNAVGSLYLSVTEFMPEETRTPALVGFTVLAQRPFQHSHVEVLRLPRPGEKKYTKVSSADLPFIPKQGSRQSWAKMTFKPAAGRGMYQVQARAWGAADGGNDWTGALAANYVHILP